MAKKFAKYKITDMSVGVSTHVHVSPIITVIITIIMYSKNNNNNNNKDNSNNIIIITTSIIVLISPHYRIKNNPVKDRAIAHERNYYCSFSSSLK